MICQLFHGDCRQVLRGLPDCSVDSIVTDPPYELGFMGKAWDASGIAYDVEMWRHCLRVLKPGGHLLAFGGTRTYHRMAVAIEDAGFEIRDSLHWIYGSGFPKSLNVSKAIDKAAGAEREVIGTARGVSVSADDNQYGGINRGAVGVKQVAVDVPITAPATDEARQWDGWGTALKPAHEPIVMARKPLIGTVAANVLQHGTGALNIDGTRVGTEVTTSHLTKFYAYNGENARPWHDNHKHTTKQNIGRWPANVIFDTEAGQLLEEQAGGASRFFTAIDWHPEIDVPFRYVPKTNKRERNAGLDGMPEVVGKRTQDGGDDTRGRPLPVNQNHHPTVKPVALMRWLVRLVTPPDGTVLDPFAGSGTTLMACVLEGFNAIGIELTDEYLPIIRGRVAWAEQQKTEPQPAQLTLG